VIRSTQERRGEKKADYIYRVMLGGLTGRKEFPLQFSILKGSLGATEGEMK